jgi:hypothetical protein
VKYVMFKKKRLLLTQYVPIIFPNHEVHSDIASALLAGPLKGFKIHSAGDWSPISNEVSGRSSTLGLDYDPADKGRIVMSDYGGSFE